MVVKKPQQTSSRAASVWTVLMLSVLWVLPAAAQEDAPPPADTPSEESAPPADAAEADAPAPEGAQDTSAEATPEPAAGGQADTETPAPQPAVPNTDEASFNLQLRGLQERVDELKQKVYKSKARLTQLKEVVMHGAISGAKARLVHKNEMGSSFRLIRVQYSLDGAPILNRADTGDGSLDDIEELEVFSGSIAPGEHQISVYLEYAGDGYGIFSYLKNYTFKIKSSFNFTAEEGKLTRVDIVGYEKGNFTTELQDRVAVRYDQSVDRATRDTDEATPSAEAE